jgi:tRNA modification GTPase
VGGIGIVRVSGPASREIAGRLFRPTAGAAPTEFASHVARHGYVRHPETGEMLDEVLLLPMHAPRSYTGEDVVEFHCHGGRQTVAAVLATVLAAGARLAEAGEFTRRAFLTGRLDLAEAEGVIELIRAGGEDARRAALLVTTGALSREVTDLRGGIIAVLADVEAAIDFAEDAGPLPLPTEAIGRLRARGEALRRKAEQGALHLDGITAVIAGRPNVGKSSLMNLLLGESRVIVTPHPGTTRDPIDAWATLGPLRIRLVDTAGIRPTSCDIEAEGVRRATEALARGSLVLLVIDGGEGLQPEEMALLKSLGSTPAMIVQNKLDLPQATPPAETARRVAPVPVVGVSSLTGEGREALAGEVCALAGLGPRGDAPLLAASFRQRELIRRCVGALRAADEASRAGAFPDAFAEELREAIDSLALITGDRWDDQLLDSIFSRFCIGK